MERLARPEMMRRRMGSWKSDGSPARERAGDWSSVSRAPNRWPVTMKRAVIPRRPLEKFQHVSVLIEVDEFNLDPSDISLIPRPHVWGAKYPIQRTLGMVRER